MTYVSTINCWILIMDDYVHVGFLFGEFVMYGFHKIKMTIANNICWKFIVKTHSNLQSSILPTITINHPSWQIYRYWTSYNIFHYILTIYEHNRAILLFRFFVQQYDRIVSHNFLLLLCVAVYVVYLNQWFPGLKLNAMARSCIRHTRHVCIRKKCMFVCSSSFALGLNLLNMTTWTV